jgi:hypothetical protein
MENANALETDGSVRLDQHESFKTEKEAIALLWHIGGEPAFAFPLLLLFSFANPSRFITDLLDLVTVYL